ncbi:hypothetical protein BCR37DRAFT_378636 [Protomyces lactucae-debilis]|uniref:Secreted protein n=1 Tax=Protomyces lactucae-debilis TaxID=2754530 RepID=A0A1Y2FJX3_PROLT|nr:uncharacterized protein BCR37DRAFT_378636 [Protomyces lactucae-debilis]ORY83674.1 hypothetical protein BCR37DRAFT_378636 [Protomyces lactucae-debilis]
MRVHNSPSATWLCAALVILVSRNYGTLRDTATVSKSHSPSFAHLALVAPPGYTPQGQGEVARIEKSPILVTHLLYDCEPLVSVCLTKKSSSAAHDEKHLRRFPET